MSLEEKVIEMSAPKEEKKKIQHTTYGNRWLQRTFARRGYIFCLPSWTGDTCNWA